MFLASFDLCSLTEEGIDGRCPSGCPFRMSFGVSIWIAAHVTAATALMGNGRLSACANMPSSDRFKLHFSIAFYRCTTLLLLGCSCSRGAINHRSVFFHFQRRSVSIGTCARIRARTRSSVDFSPFSSLLANQ